MIEGYDKLSKEQRELIHRVNELHSKCVGNEYKAGMEILKVWVNDKGIVCVHLLNGEWYHYTESHKWY